MSCTLVNRWISDVLLPIGYRHHKRSYWIKNTDECQLVVYLQTAREFCYINLGVFVSCIDDVQSFEDFSSGWHIGKRADLEIGELLNFGKPVDLVKVESEFKQILENILIPQLESMGSIEDIKKVLRNETDFCPVGAKTFRFFGLPLGPRRFYGGGGIVSVPNAEVHPSRILAESKDIKIYMLFERDMKTDEIKQVGTVNSINEAESWSKSWFKDITREEAADILHRFIQATTEGNEFRYFLSEPISHDQIIENARDTIARIPKEALQFRKKEAIEAVQAAERLLRESHSN